ncbi:MAG: GFA family protein [Gammaproteobacteria bacterium]|nr:GFA family protein [Gammaproteobacteria bacterium]
MARTTEATGGCLCGAVRYEITGPMRRVVYCHCGQCRKTSGHYVAATAVSHDDLRFVEDAGLSWYTSSDTADRGFCHRCGSSLFWRPAHGRYMAVMAGAIDAPTGLTAKEHIYVADASDYYAIGDGLPQFEQNHPELWDDVE